MPNLVRFRSTAQISAAALLLVASSGALAMSQPPQCIASVVGSTHVAPQVIEPAPQMGEPESTIPVAPSIEASRPVEPSGGSLLLPQPAAPVSANAKKKKPERLQ